MDISALHVLYVLFGQADLLRLLRSIRPAVGEDEAPKFVTRTPRKQGKDININKYIYIYMYLTNDKVTCAAGTTVKTPNLTNSWN